MQLVEAEKHITKITNESERRVADLLLNLGFTFIDSDSIILNSKKQRIGEIDLIFTFEDYLFLIEVSKDKHSGNSKKITFFTKWEDRDNLEIVRNTYELRPRKVMRIYFDLSTKTPENSSAEIQRITQSGKLNKVAYLDDYEHFFNSRKKIGPWAKNDLLDWLEFSDEKKSKQIDAIQYYIGSVPIFCFVEKVHNLLRTCYVSRRRKKDFGYQRTLREQRVLNISNNIKSGKGLSFPNSILINTPELISSKVPPEECPKVVKINFPMGYNTSRIIDGQHRLLGFSVLPSELQKMYYLPVIALEDFDRKKEIETFVDINSKQQRIDRNLILLLKADLEWNKGTKEFKEQRKIRDVPVWVPKRELLIILKTIAAVDRSARLDKKGGDDDENLQSKIWKDYRDIAVLVVGQKLDKEFLRKYIKQSHLRKYMDDFLSRYKQEENKRVLDELGSSPEEIESALKV